CERLQEIGKTLSLALHKHGLPIEWLEGPCIPGEDVASTRDPVRALAVNQVPDNIERAPGSFPLGGKHPDRSQSGKKRRERRRSGFKHRESVIEIEVHSGFPRRC